VPSALRRAHAEEGPDGFVVTMEAVHGGNDFTWRGVYRGSNDGTVGLEMEGVAERDLVYRRIGICVLHPWTSYVGARYEAMGSAGAVSGTFPVEIAPQLRVDGEYQPMIPAFRNLVVDLEAGLRVGFAFEGEDEGFELEDQRNWTDASFKTYPTPLRSSRPRTLRRGDRLRQRLVMRIEGVPPVASVDGGPIVVRVGDATGHAMPPVGVSAPSSHTDPTVISSMRPAHLRVSVDPDVEDGGLGRAVSLVRETAIPLELVLLVGDATTDLGEVVATTNGSPLARIVALRRDGRVSGGTFLAAIRERLGPIGAPVLGGTSSHFSELNRDWPGADGMDGVAVAMSPQVHRVDEASMVETLEIQAQIVRRLRSLSGGLPIVVSPVTLAVHDPMLGETDVDERVRSAFGAAWTAGSAASLASAGTASISFHEPVDRTVAGFLPMVRALSLLAARRGTALHEVRSAHPRKVTALITAGRAPIVVNLTDAPQTAVLEGATSGRVDLSPYEVAELGRSPR
jgi:hypothetical protein